MIISINITTSLTLAFFESVTALSLKSFSWTYENMPFINVYVKFQENKIFDWLAIPIDEKMDIQQFFDHFSAIYLRSKIFKFWGHCTFGSTKSSLFSNYNEVSLECNTLEIINVFGINCIFKLNEERLTSKVLINSRNIIVVMNAQLE